MADHEPVAATLVTAGVGLAVMIEDEAGISVDVDRF